MVKDALHGRLGHAVRPSVWSGALAQAADRSPLPTIGTDSLVADNPVVFANEAFLAMTGAARDDVLSRPVMEVFGGRTDCAALSRFGAALAAGRSGSWRMRIRREDDAAAPGIVYMAAIRDEADRVLGHCINIADLETLNRRPDKRAGIAPAAYDHAPGFIAIAKGAEHRFEYTNAAYRAFVKRDHLIGRTVAEALPEMAEQGFVAVLDEVYRTGEPFRGSDLPISVRDPAAGSLQRRWIDVLYQPLRDDHGAICGLFCEGQDVTDLHKINSTLAALQMKMIHASRVNAMGTMAANLAHELNQPLTAITNYLAGVRARGGRKPEADRLETALEGIGEATRCASDILDRLRQLTKHRTPRREPFNLRDAVAECARLVGSSCRTAIRFDNRVADDTIMVAERVKIQQVLINLLQNACEAMADTECALVTIAASEDDRGITFCIADNGPGVAPEAAATMFSWTESLKPDGMGIGLSICRTIISHFGGRIWLEQTGPRGSEFRFWLPSPRSPEFAEDAGAPPPS